MDPIGLLSLLTGCKINTMFQKKEKARPLEPEGLDVHNPELDVVVKLVQEPARLKEIIPKRANEDDDENYISLRSQFNPKKR